MINEEALINFLEGQRYILSDDTSESFEKEHQYELGNNRMIEKTLDWIYSTKKIRGGK